jgi:hypothetical protein
MNTKTLVILAYIAITGCIAAGYVVAPRGHATQNSAKYKPSIEVHTCYELRLGADGKFPLWDKLAFDEKLIFDEEESKDTPFDAAGWVTDLKYTTIGYGCHGDCDYNAIFNVMRVAETKLWPAQVDEKSGETYHLPCGGSAMCRRPYLAENVPCYVEETDCNFGDGTKYHDPKVLHTYLLDCRGDVVCTAEGLSPDKCCLVTKVVNGAVNGLEDEDS